MLPVNLLYIGRGLWQVPEIGVRLGGIFIPPGFISDLDTVPRLPVFHAWLKGRTISAALLHDYLYASGTHKKIADHLFLIAMAHEGVRARYRYPIYWAVKLLGSSRYKRVSARVKNNTDRYI